MIRLQMNRERKIILIVGGILLLLGIAYRFMPSLDLFIPDRNETAIKQSRIERYEQKIAQKKSLEQQKLRLSKTFERLKIGLLQGKTASLAAVAMQNRLNDISDVLNLNITSMRVLKEVKIENTDIVAIRVQFSVDLSMRQLKRLLYKIETSDSYLHIENMQLRASRMTDAEKITANLTVVGYLLEHA